MGTKQVHLPEFFKVYISQRCPERLQLPLAFNRHLSQPVPETVVIKTSNGNFWTIGLTRRQECIFFESGWPKFTEVMGLKYGEFLVFVYYAPRSFRVSVYGRSTCWERRGQMVIQEIPKGQEEIEQVDVGDNDLDEKGDDDSDSVHSLGSQDETTHEEVVLKTPIKKKRRKHQKMGKKADDGSDSCYRFGDEDETTHREVVLAPRKKKCTKHQKKGKKADDNSGSCYLLGSEDETTDEEVVVETPREKKHREHQKSGQKGKSRGRFVSVENVERYLDDPTNPFFVTMLKTRNFELLVHEHIVKDYKLKFTDTISFISPYGRIKGRKANWVDGRACIRGWSSVCRMNKLKPEDRVICELLQTGDVVKSIKVHIIRKLM